MPCKPGCEPPFVSVGRINFGPLDRVYSSPNSTVTFVIRNEETIPCSCGKKMILRKRTNSAWPPYPGNEFWWCGGCGSIFPYGPRDFPDPEMEEKSARKAWEEANNV